MTKRTRTATRSFFVARVTFWTAAVAVEWLASPIALRAEQPAANAATLPVADGDGGQANLRDYDQRVRPLLGKYCFECHGPEEPSSDVRLDLLDPDTIGGGDADHWDAALDMINMGYMPPEGERQPSDAERRELVDWMTKAIDLAKRFRQRPSAGAIRRLTREQYSNSLAELLSLPIDFGRNLPDEPKSRMGFSNSSDSLLISPLHVEYYQSIAREAIDKAIKTGDRPEPKRYRATLGANVGLGRHAAVIDGFQSAPIPREHVRVEVLDEHGRPRIGLTPAEVAELREIESNIGVDMRGSSSDRYRITDDGLILFSALPHVEQAPMSWQGPSPNMMLLLRRCFPSEGPFVTRVTASLANYANGYQAEGLLQLRSTEPMTRLTSDSTALVAPADAIVLTAADCKQQSGLTLQGGALAPEDVTKTSSGSFSFQVSKPGLYQIDLVHPAAAENGMPSVSLELDRWAQHLRVEPGTPGQNGLSVTPMAHAQLSPGTHRLTVGGRFFVGFREVVVSPIPDDHPVSVSLRDERSRSQEGPAGRDSALRAFVGSRTDDGMEYAELDQSRVVDSRSGELETYEFRGYLENLPIPILDETEQSSLSNIMVVGVWNDHLVKDSSDCGVPIVVRSIEFEGPSYPVWPPESHQQVFFESPLRETDPDGYTREVISRFMTRAFRRAVDPHEVDRYVDFWTATRGDYDNYYEGVKETLVAVLCSPHFLYFGGPDAPAADDAGLAERLAYFLWNSPPDEELRRLAAEGTLRRELPRQVERMIADARIERFIDTFAVDWLRLNRHASMDVNVDAYSDYTRFVKRDMAMETKAFLLYVLREKLSLLTFIDSDFAMLNQNLAEFYGVSGVEGTHFRPVPVAPEMHRGGLLSQGAFLCGHSDGTQAHPIKRAVWLKEKILGSPVPPPPPNVPALNPETPGFEKLTLKEQLELHRDKPSCADCHRTIDPYGVVFENYDAVGRFRTQAKGRPVDARSVLPEGVEIDGVDQLKEYLLENQRDVVTRTVISHLLAYALGRDVSYSDEQEIDELVARVAADKYNLQTAVLAIAESAAFSGLSVEPPKPERQRDLP